MCDGKDILWNTLKHLEALREIGPKWTLCTTLDFLKIDISVTRNIVELIKVDLLLQTSTKMIGAGDGS